MPFGSLNLRSFMAHYRSLTKTRSGSPKQSVISLKGMTEASPLQFVGGGTGLPWHSAVGGGTATVGLPVVGSG